ncbi:MAG: beta-ketoacyl synthase N-terminal-like domain-containing protein [Campylobacterota bacterium]
MPHSVYINGSSLHCYLGENKQECTQQMHTLNSSGYDAFLRRVGDEGGYFVRRSYANADEKIYRMLFNVIDDAIKDAGYDRTQRKELRIFIGSTSMNMAQNEDFFEHGRQKLKNMGYGYIADMVQEIAGSGFTPVVFSTACTSSANALITAAEMIKHEKIDKALILGFELYNYITYKGFESLMLISKSKQYKPFDQNSDGIILGEGCSALVIDRQRKSGSFEVLGGYTQNDTYSETTTAPDGRIVAQTIHKALQNAGTAFEDVDCIKAHATGSENNNRSEARAICSVFESFGHSCPVTALKPLLGHTLGASGTNELVLMMEAVKAGFLPRTLGFAAPLEGIDLVPLQEQKSIARATIVNNYVGFGGSSSSLVISNKGV